MGAGRDRYHRPFLGREEVVGGGEGGWVFALAAWVSCGGGSSSSDAPEDVVQGEAPVGEADPGSGLGREVGSDGPATEDGTLSDPGDDGASPDGIPDHPVPGDGTTEAADASELPPLRLKPPVAPPTDPLARKGVESCPIYEDTRCEAGRLQVCRIHDPTTGAFVEDPDPLLRRVLLLERWRDKYGRPDGQTSEIAFREPTPPGTPESEWSRRPNASHPTRAWGIRGSGPVGP